MRSRLVAIVMMVVATLGAVAVSTLVASPASAHGKCEIEDGVKTCW